MKNYIIIANGSFLVREIIQEAIQNQIIVALDGAANKLLRMGIQPHLILGDMDSIHLEPAIHHVPKVRVDNQEQTDLIKAIRYCDAQNAHEISIICATGGRLDHHECAIRSLRTEYKKDRLIQLHTEQQTLRYVKDESIVMQGEIGDKCGIVAFPKGALTSQGLAYDVNNYELNFGFSESICNSLNTPQALISITGEALLIMPPKFTAQQEYMKKSEIERLEMQLRDAQG